MARRETTQMGLWVTILTVPEPLNLSGWAFACFTC